MPGQLYIVWPTMLVACASPAGCSCTRRQRTDLSRRPRYSRNPRERPRREDKRKNSRSTLSRPPDLNTEALFVSLYRSAEPTDSSRRTTELLTSKCDESRIYIARRVVTAWIGRGVPARTGSWKVHGPRIQVAMCEEGCCIQALMRTYCHVSFASV